MPNQPQGVTSDSSDQSAASKPQESRSKDRKPIKAEQRKEKRKEKYIRLIKSPELNSLSPLQKEFLTERWLEQMDWFSEKARSYQDWFYKIRLSTIIISVLVPVLVSLGSVSSGSLIGSRLLESASQPSPVSAFTEQVDTGPRIQGSSYNWFLLLGLILSQIVAILAAIEQFYKFGDRWRLYRRTAEVLKSHGWQFFQLGGPYAAYAKLGGHKEAFPLFAAQVEEVIQNDVEGFVRQTAMQAKPEKSEEQSQDESQ